MPYLAAIASYGFDHVPTAAILAVYRHMGVHAVQFFRHPGNAPTPQEARRLADEAGLAFDSIHGVFGNGYDPSSPDESLRQATISAYEAEGRLALDLGGPMVVVHPGPAVVDQADLSPPVQSQRTESLKRSLADLGQLGDRLGVTYLVENLPPTCAAGFNPAELARMIRRLNHQRVRMCFDIGHAHITTGVVPAFAACRDVIGYVHVSDNLGQEDQHLFPGEGTIDWDTLGQLLGTLPPGVAAMLEIFKNDAEFQTRMAAGWRVKLDKWLGLKA